MLSGAVTAYYDAWRWSGWEAEVDALALDHGIYTFPPPWTREGKDLTTVARKAVPLVELASFHQDAARQLRNLRPQ